MKLHSKLDRPFHVWCFLAKMGFYPPRTSPLLHTITTLKPGYFMSHHMHSSSLCLIGIFERAALQKATHTPIPAYVNWQLCHSNSLASCQAVDVARQRFPWQHSFCHLGTGGWRQPRQISVEHRIAFTWEKRVHSYFSRS